MDVQRVLDILLAIFSWVVLTAVGIIVSGKLVSQRIPLGLNSDDHLSIPLAIFSFKARGDEVCIGLTLFVLMLGLVAGLAGADAYTFFKGRTGLDIGQWNSLCAISSFLCVLLATMIWLLAPLFRRSPIISDNERASQIQRLGGARRRPRNGR